MLHLHNPPFSPTYSITQRIRSQTVSRDLSGRTAKTMVVHSPVAIYNDKKMHLLNLFFYRHVQLILTSILQGMCRIITFLFKKERMCVGRDINKPSPHTAGNLNFCFNVLLKCVWVVIWFSHIFIHTTAITICGTLF